VAFIPPEAREKKRVKCPPLFHRLGTRKKRKRVRKPISRPLGRRKKEGVAGPQIRPSNGKRFCHVDVLRAREKEKKGGKHEGR